jgi:hypothetical protein
MRASVMGKIPLAAFADASESATEIPRSAVSIDRVPVLVAVSQTGATRLTQHSTCDFERCSIASAIRTPEPDERDPPEGGGSLQLDKHAADRRPTKVYGCAYQTTAEDACDVGHETVVAFLVVIAGEGGSVELWADSGLKHSVLLCLWLAG